MEELDWKCKIKTLFPERKCSGRNGRGRGGKSIKRFSRINRLGLILEKNDPLSRHRESIIRTGLGWAGLGKTESNYIQYSERREFCRPAEIFSTNTPLSGSIIQNFKPKLPHWL